MLRGGGADSGESQVPELNAAATGEPGANAVLDAGQNAALPEANQQQAEQADTSEDLRREAARAEAAEARLEELRRAQARAARLLGAPVELTPERQAGESEGGAVIGVLHHSNLRLNVGIGIAFTACALCAYGILAWSTTFLTERGFTLAQAGNAVSIGGVTSIVASIAPGLLVYRFGSKAVVTGDRTQVDVGGGRSGLDGLEDLLSHIDDISFVHLGSRDVVRHRIVQDIVEAYDRRAATEGRST